METQEPDMTIGEIREALEIGFSELEIHNTGGRGKKARRQGSGKYTPDPEKIAAMAVRIEAAAKLDPTRTSGPTVEEWTGGLSGENT